MTHPALSRRDFLRIGAASAAATLASPLIAAPSVASTACIQVLLTGGPSHIDTWDPKPNAPSDIRGPFRPIRTTVPGLHLSELFPRMAQSAHRFALVRSLHHNEAPIHETGQQLLQTGSLFAGGAEFPHFGAVVSRLAPGSPREGLPSWVVLPGPVGDTGVDISHGQGAGFLGEQHVPKFLRPDLADEPVRLRERYGHTPFAASCLQARRLVEQGVRVVTVNMFDTVFGRVTWDCHAAGGDLNTTLADYARIVCPDFDQAFTALLEDLDQRGMLASTLVVAAGEFGRTPRVNSRGGRDHWAGVWSAILAGGGVRGGQVLGASDRLGAEVKERPVALPQVFQTVSTVLIPDLGYPLLSELF